MLDINYKTEIEKTSSLLCTLKMPGKMLKEPSILLTDSEDTDQPALRMSRLIRILIGHSHNSSYCGSEAFHTWIQVLSAGELRHRKNNEDKVFSHP